VPVARQRALDGHVALSYAPVEQASAAVALASAFQVRGQHYPDRYETGWFQAIASYLASIRNGMVAWAGIGDAPPPGIDPITTATVPEGN
jgi:hypothetical protein